MCVGGTNRPTTDVPAEIAPLRAVAETVGLMSSICPNSPTIAFSASIIPKMATPRNVQGAAQSGAEWGARSDPTTRGGATSCTA